MPAKGNPAFRRATRGTSTMPSTQTDPSTNVAHEDLEQVGQKLLADHHDLERRCNLSFVQIDAWLSQQQVNVKHLQGILEKLEKDSNATKEIFSRLVEQSAQNGQNNTQSQTHAQSQLAIHTDLADTIATIQSKIQGLHQEARQEVLNRLDFERSNIVQTVIQQLGIRGISEKTLQTSQGEIQELVRGACAQVREISEINLRNETKHYKEQYAKDLEAQLGKIRATVTNNHELQNQLQFKLVQECKHELDCRWKCEFGKLENHYNQGYLKLQAQVDEFQKIVDEYKVNIESRYQEEMQQFKESVRSDIRKQHNQDAEGLRAKLSSIQKDLADGADIAEKNDRDLHKAKAQLSKLHDLIASEAEHHPNNQHKKSETQMDALRNLIRCEVETLVASHGRQQDQHMVDVEPLNTGQPNRGDNSNRNSAVMEKLGSILTACNNLAQS